MRLAPIGLRFAAGILFPANAVRHCTPLTVLVVAGSKICPCRIFEPSHGLTARTVLVRSAEKSPPFSAAVGTLMLLTPPWFWRYCSQPKKKNVRFFPL